MGGKSYFFFDSSKTESKPALPDVYWDGKPEHGLANDPMTGKPRVFASRAEKAQYLKERNLTEAGDRVRGGLRMPGCVESGDSPGNPGNRDAAMQAIHQVKQMGQDVRRQAYLKILKEGRR